MSRGTDIVAAFFIEVLLINKMTHRRRRRLLHRGLARCYENYGASVLYRIECTGCIGRKDMKQPKGICKIFRRSDRGAMERPGNMSWRVAYAMISFSSVQWCQFEENVFRFIFLPHEDYADS